MVTIPPIDFISSAVSVVILMAFAKSAINGAIRSAWNIANRAEDELDKIESIDDRTEELGEETEELRKDIRQVGSKVDKVSKVQIAQLKFGNDGLDEERAIGDLMPNDNTIERYRED